MKNFFKLIAKLNRLILPSLTKRKVDLAKASKWQLALFGWRIFITKKALD